MGKSFFTVLGIVLSFNLLGCSNPQAEEPLFQQPILTLAEIEELARLKIPENVEVIETYSFVSTPDPAAWLKLRFPCAERQAFLASIGHTENLSTTERFLFNRDLEQMSWWKPDSIGSFESGKIKKENDFMRLVLAEQGRTNSCLAYVFNHHI